MLTVMPDFKAIPDAHWFRAEAISAAAMWGRDLSEFNFPASILMLLDFSHSMTKPLGLKGVRFDAEGMMLQLALLNEGCNPGSAWLTEAVKCGWRYRGDKGYYREEQ